MLEYSHDPRLVLAAFAIALMAGFTGLSLTRGANALPVGQRKAVICMAAVALGGGIWSMHFVAMLGLRLPILYTYDALVTLLSALVAILLTGLALLILHFRPRTSRNLGLAGAIIGGGIALMHYIGMSGMELCSPVYTVPGVAGALAASVALSILAIRIAYSERGRRNILLGAAGFGAAVIMAHFLAMAGTGFLPDPQSDALGPALENGTLAIIVTLAAFVISAAFLLSGITFFPTPEETPQAATIPSVETATAPVARRVDPPRADPPLKVPHEREGRTFFLDPASISVIRAEGHYTLLQRGMETLFCPWSISEAEERLASAGFLRVHRSYLLNPARVTRFEKLKDSGECSVEGADGLRIPVSRTRLSTLREVLGL